MKKAAQVEEPAKKSDPSPLDSSELSLPNENVITLDPNVPIDDAVKAAQQEDEAASTVIDNE